MAASDPASFAWYGVDRSSELVEMESSTKAAIAGRSQPEDDTGPCPARGDPGGAAPCTWGIVLAGLASAHRADRPAWGPRDGPSKRNPSARNRWSIERVNIDSNPEKPTCLMSSCGCLPWHWAHSS